jgi:hypothetical protein
MRRSLSTLLVLAVAIAGPVAAVSAQDKTFERQTLLDGRLTVELPTLLKPMTDEQRLAKYGRGNAPPIAYADPSGDISFALNWTQHRMSRGEVETRTRQMREQIASVAPIKRWHDTKVETIGGRPAGVLDFDSERPDVRNKIMLVELDGRILLVTFNMTKQHEAEWGLVADRVLRSAQFR